MFQRPEPLTSFQSTADDGLDVPRLAAMMERQARWIALCVVAGLATAIAALFVLPVRYSATALVSVDGAVERQMERGEASRSGQESMTLVDSQVEIAQSPAIIERAVQALGMTAADLPATATWSFGMRSADAAELLSPADQRVQLQLQENLAVRTHVARRGETYVIAISVEAASAAIAAAQANAVAEAYLADQVETKRRAAQMAEDALSDQLEGLSADLRRLATR